MEVEKSYIEIDLISVLKQLWIKKRFIFSVVAIFIVLGVLVSFMRTRNFEARTSFVPQSSSSSKGLKGKLGGLAALAGINIGAEGSSDISPTLYPKIANSIEFKKALLKEQFYFQKYKQKLTFAEFIKKEKEKEGVREMDSQRKLFWEEIKNAENENILSLDFETYNLCEKLGKRVNILVNEEGGYISVVCNLPDRIAAAELTEKAKNILQASVIKLRIKKAKEKLKFLEARAEEKKLEYDQAQFALAQYRDANKNVSTEIAKTQLQRLESNYNLIFSLYSEFLQQIETQRIQVKSDTPIFTVIEKTSIPIKPVGKSAIFIIAIFIFIGFIFSIGTVLIKPIFLNLKREWKDSETS